MELRILVTNTDRATPPVRPYENGGENVKHEDVRNLLNEVMLVNETGEVVAAGTRDQMYSFVKHNVDDGDY